MRKGLFVTAVSLTLKNAYVIYKHSPNLLVKVLLSVLFHW